MALYERWLLMILDKDKDEGGCQDGSDSRGPAT